MNIKSGNSHMYKTIATIATSNKFTFSAAEHIVLNCVVFLDSIDDVCG